MLDLQTCKIIGIVVEKTTRGPGTIYLTRPGAYVLWEMKS